MKLISRLFEIGLFEDMEIYERRRISIINKLYLVGFISYIIFFSIQFSSGHYIVSVLSILSLFVIILAFYLNHIKKNTLSPALFFFFVVTNVFLQALFLKANIGNEYILLSMIGLPLITLPPEYKKLIFTEIFYVGILAFLVVALKLDQVGIYTIDPSLAGNVHKTSFIEAFAISFFTLIIFVNEMEKRYNLYNQNKERFYAQSRLSDLGLMSAGIAHEINNPLTIIQNQATILGKKVAQDTREQERIKSIIQQCKRIFSIIIGLKHIARDGFGDQIEKSSLLKILDQVLELSKQKLSNENVELTLKLPEEEIYSCVRSVQIEQVLFSLISNAVDAMEELAKRKKITISMTKNIRYVFIQIVDNGPGVPFALREEVMKPFYTTKELGKGTGLGLSVARGIIEEHQGTLTLDTHAPRGACFTIKLPLAKEQEFPSKAAS